MSEAPIRLGVLGAGMIATVGYGVLPGLRHIPDKVEVLAIADPALDRAREAAAAFGIPHAFATLEEMLERVDMDAVINLTPIPFHGPTSIKILQAGKHLATEKPLATTMEDADAIVELARAQGLIVVCSPPNMLYPSRVEARRLVREGAIGQVAFARVRGSHGGPASGDWPMDPTWFYQEGSGPLYDMGVYGIHEITGIVGPARRVVAFSGITEPVRTVRGGPFKGKEIRVTADDNTVMMLDFGNSAYAFVDGTFNVNAAKSPRVEIFGRAGTLNISQGGDPALEVYRLDALPGLSGWTVPTLREVSSAQARADKLRRGILVDHLVDCIRGASTPVLSAEHGRHALEIMLKAQESARGGRALDLTTTFPEPDGAPEPARAGLGEERDPQP
ncbi:MAG TPA: Gfo/Idh/MocA family oxidoreductase [Candidatus Dormibacteraeota bacterium]|jgi:predicted dehydrogenase|nr:Gfo/Idh/MocA family oxidoreductase [Candidatus Dormibacteraeota bacterium]